MSIPKPMLLTALLLVDFVLFIIGVTTVGAPAVAFDANVIALVLAMAIGLILVHDARRRRKW